MPSILTRDVDEGIGTASWTFFGGGVFASGRVTVDANPMVIPLPAGWDSGDIALATLQSDDTGGSLGGVVGASIAAGNLTITFASAPSNDDGVVGYTIVTPDVEV